MGFHSCFKDVQLGCGVNFSCFINDVPEEIQDLDVYLCLYGVNSEYEVESIVFC